MKEVYIIDGIRTPVGNFGGALSPVRADDLAAVVVKEVTNRNPSIPLESYDDVILGCHNQAGEDNRNVARMASLLAGLPVTVPGETVNRLCASGMSAIVNASRGIPGGVMVIASPANISLTGPLSSYARNLNIDLVQFSSFYKMNGSLMNVRFMTTSTINLFNTAIRLGGTSVPAYRSPN